MKLTQSVMDRLAIGLSVMCTVHCFATPLLLALLPSLAALQLDNEQFHIWMLAAVLPSSLLALSIGCKKHKRISYVLLGVTGLGLLIFAVTFGEMWWGETGEKSLTLAGSAFIAIAHWFNFRQCHKKSRERCDCS